MKFLPILIACVALTAACNPKIPNNEFNGNKSNCNKLLVGNFETVQCFVNCFMESLGVLRDGQIQPKVMLHKLGPILGHELVEAAQAKCDGIHLANRCNFAWELNKCYFNVGLVIVDIKRDKTNVLGQK